MEAIDLIIQPDEEEAGAAEILVDGLIGSHPYRFLLDTGAAKTSVVADEYTAGFASHQRDDSSGVFAQSSDDLITVPSIQVGPIARQGFTLSRMAHSGPVNRNLIGMDLLKDFECHFLFDENRLLIGASGAVENDRNFQELFLDARAHPYVDVQFEAAIARAVWDTGAGLTIVDLGFVQRHPGLFSEAGVSLGTDSTGLSLETPMFILDAPMLGNIPFPAPKVACVDLGPVNASLEVPMDLILGYNVLSKANWRFDFPGKRWAITRMLAAD